MDNYTVDVELMDEDDIRLTFYMNNVDIIRFEFTKSSFNKSKLKKFKTMINGDKNDEVTILNSNGFIGFIKKANILTIECSRYDDYPNCGNLECKFIINSEIEKLINKLELL